MGEKIGIDLGYAYITLTTAAGISREASIALVDKTTNRILSLGDSALDSDNGTGVLVRPFKNGLLYSSELTSEIIRDAVGAVKPSTSIRALLAVPSDINPKQEKTLFAMMRDAGVTEGFTVTRSVAALIGAGYAPTIDAVSVNVGAGYTDISVLHGGKVILSDCRPIGGEAFDRAVKDYVYSQGEVSISLSVARTIKERLCSVWPGKPSESIDIEGTLALTGNRIKMTVGTEDFLSVFEKPLGELLLAIADTVKRIPMDAVQDVFKNGIILSGGGAELYGLDKMIAKVLDIPVTLAVDPMDAVAKGMARIHTRLLPEKMRTNEKNVTSLLAKYHTAAKEKEKKDEERKNAK